MIDVRVSIKKHEGDDVYSWAVFVNGVVVTGLTGLSRREARFLRSLLTTASREQRAAARERITDGHIK